MVAFLVGRNYTPTSAQRMSESKGIIKALQSNSRKVSLAFASTPTVTGNSLLPKALSSIFVQLCLRHSSSLLIPVFNHQHKPVRVQRLLEGGC